MNYCKDYTKYAVSNGLSSNTLDSYMRHQNSLINPTILEERELNVVGYDVFSRLLYDRIIFLGTEVNRDVANIITSQLLYLRTIDDSDISLFINSPGGSVTDGLAIYDMMNFITPDVKTTCMGMCASMGAVLLSAGAKGKRSSNPHGSIMLHEPLSGIAPNTKCTDFLIEAEEMKKCKDTLFSILSENCGKTIEELEVACQHDKWLTAQEALDFGVIDKINNKK